MENQVNKVANLFQIFLNIIRLDLMFSSYFFKSQKHKKCILSFHLYPF